MLGVEALPAIGGAAEPSRTLILKPRPNATGWRSIFGFAREWFTDQ